MYAKLPRRRDVHIVGKHLAGKLNEVADDISRNTFSLLLPDRAAKLFRVHPTLVSLDYFQPSPGLLQLLTSRLFLKLSQLPCALPTALGLFVPVGSITCISVTL